MKRGKWIAKVLMMVALGIVAVAALSAEDRERFKQKMKDKWCYREPSQKDGSTIG
jgi:hypothetical protein